MNDKSTTPLIADLLALVHKHGMESFQDVLNVLSSPERTERIRSAIEGLLALAEQTRASGTLARKRLAEQSGLTKPPRRPNVRRRHWSQERDALLARLATLPRSQATDLLGLLTSEDHSTKPDIELTAKLEDLIQKLDQKSFGRFIKRMNVPEEAHERSLMDWAKLILAPDKKPTKS